MAKSEFATKFDEFSVVSLSLAIDWNHFNALITNEGEQILNWMWLSNALDCVRVRRSISFHCRCKLWNVFAHAILFQPRTNKMRLFFSFLHHLVGFQIGRCFFIVLLLLDSRQAQVCVLFLSLVVFYFVFFLNKFIDKSWKPKTNYGTNRLIDKKSAKENENWMK